MHQILVRARDIRPSLLEKDTRLDIDRPGVIPAQLLNRLKAEEPDIGVHLDLGSHMGDPVQQTLLEGRLSTRVNIVRRKGVFDRCRTLHMVADHAVGLHRHAVDGHRLVEVEMAFNEPGRHQPTTGIVRLAITGKLWFYSHDETFQHANIDRGMIRAKTRKPCVSNDEIECHLPRLLPRLLSRRMERRWDGAMGA